MLFFTSLLHVLGNRGQKALKGNATEGGKDSACQGAIKTELLPQARWTGSQGDPTAHPTALEQGKWDRHGDGTSKVLDHKAVSQQGGRHPSRSGPTATRQPHIDKQQPRSSQEVSPGWGIRSQPGGSITKLGMAVPQLETSTPSAQLRQGGSRLPQLSLNRAAESMGEGGGPRWGWSEPLTLISALRALTLLSYLCLLSYLLSVGVLFMENQSNLEPVCLETIIML